MKNRNLSDFPESGPRFAKVANGNPPKRFLLRLGLLLNHSSYQGQERGLYLLTRQLPYSLFIA